MNPILARGLSGIAAGDEVIVVTWLHRADRDVIEVHPRGDPEVPLAGVFATRSPDRPNPLGLHRVTVREVSGTRPCACACEAAELGSPSLTTATMGASMVNAYDFMSEVHSVIRVVDIHSLTDFQRRAKSHIARLKKTGRPEVLTVNGKAEVVVQYAAAYQKMLDALDHAEAVARIRCGLESMERGEGRPMREALSALRRKHRIPRTA